MPNAQVALNALPACATLPVLIPGTYLPLTAVLGGLLFVRPEGYLEGDRDVIRLDPDVGVMQAQQGYVCCNPTPASFRQGRDTYVPPLHCCVRVLPSQVGVLSFLLHCLLSLHSGCFFVNPNVFLQKLKFLPQSASLP